MTRLLIAFSIGCSAISAPTVDASTPRVAAVELAGGGQQFSIDSTELARILTAPSRKPRVYNAWATWCGPCVAEMPALDAFATTHPDVEVWFVNTDHPKVASKQVDRFLIEHGLDDRQHLRPAPTESDLTSQVPAFPDVLPVTLLVAPSGERHRIFIGAVDAALLSEAAGSLGNSLP